ncbi:hypothetical protein [Amycolatopsis sp. NPDC098790]|uniref:hypothetical protein n=1 Tax=Amycolatopsis sp. NPDC098790 TaxID=3363939 RepID=UPI0037FA6D02
MLRKNRKSGSERHALTRRRGLLMAADLPGFAIVAGLLLPVLAAAAWAVALERRPRRADPAPDLEPDWTVAGIQARLRFEQAAESGTAALPTLPIPEQTRRDSSPDRLPWRTPRTLPPPRPPSGRFLMPQLAFAAPDNELMRRILDGLRKMD